MTIRVWSFLGAVLLMLAIAPQAASGAVSSSRTTIAVGYTATTTSDPSTDQCSVPVDSRTGAWTCPDTTPTSAARAARAARAALGKKLVSAADVAAAGTGWCTIDGCWTKIDSATNTFDGSVTYGYGGTMLGTGRLHFKIVAKGSNIKAYPLWFSASRGTTNIIISTEDLYVSSARPEGNHQDPILYAQKSWGSAAGGVSTQWPSPGKSWTNGVAYVTVANEAQWQDYSSQYPGTWYMWAKSIKLARQSSGAYNSQCDSCVPQDPAGSGWK